MGRMAHLLRSPRPVIAPPLRTECGRFSDFAARGWVAIRAGEADIEDFPELFFFCPDCAEREFG
jgi:hypothetical protein